MVTHSSGNHGAALAYAARSRGIPAWIVMPANAAQVKQDDGAAASARRSASASRTSPRARPPCAEVQAETGATLVHPFDDWRVIAGQGTAALELLEDAAGARRRHRAGGRWRPALGHGALLREGHPAVDQGLRRGAGRAPTTRSDRCRAGTIIPQTDPHTIADGLRSSLGAQDFRGAGSTVDQIGTASEEAIVRAMRLIWDSSR